MQATIPAQGKHFSKWQSIGLVFCCTILGAAAQMLMKTGLNQLSPPGWTGMLEVFAGFCLYGINTVMLIFALRDGELSILYPVIALTYVWVTLLSWTVFHETINIFKAVGVTTIVIGVGVLGKGGK